MIFNILDNTTELWMTKYIIGEIFSSGGATLYKNPSDQTGSGSGNADWSALNGSTGNVDFFISLSPIGKEFTKPFNVEIPSSKNILSKEFKENKYFTFSQYERSYFYEKSLPSFCS